MYWLFSQIWDSMRPASSALGEARGALACARPSWNYGLDHRETGTWEFLKHVSVKLGNPRSPTLSPSQHALGAEAHDRQGFLLCPSLSNHLISLGTTTNFQSTSLDSCGPGHTGYTWAGWEATVIKLASVYKAVFSVHLGPSVKGDTLEFIFPCDTP